MQLLQGFLLSSIRYGDQDVVLNFFTKENGFDTFFARNVYARKNRKKPYLFPLNELRFSLVHSSRSGSMKTVSTLEPAVDMQQEFDVRAGTVMFFVAEFLNRILRNENASEAIYEEISVFRNYLKDHNFNAHLIFLIRLMKILGHMPLVSSQPYLNPEDAEFSAEIQHHTFTEEISAFWRDILMSERPYDEILIPPASRKKLLDSILVYCFYHIPEFRVPDSLEIIQQIFE